MYNIKIFNNNRFNLMKNNNNNNKENYKDIKRSNILSNYFISFLIFNLKPLHFYIRHSDKHRYDYYKSDSY